MSTNINIKEKYKLYGSCLVKQITRRPDAGISWGQDARVNEGCSEVSSFHALNDVLHYIVVGPDGGGLGGSESSHGDGMGSLSNTESLLSSSSVSSGSAVGSVSSSTGNTGSSLMDDSSPVSSLGSSESLSPEMSLVEGSESMLVGVSSNSSPVCERPLSVLDVSVGSVLLVSPVPLGSDGSSEVVGLGVNISEGSTSVVMSTRLSGSSSVVGMGGSVVSSDLGPEDLGESSSLSSSPSSVTVSPEVLEGLVSSLGSKSRVLLEESSSGG